MLRGEGLGRRPETRPPLQSPVKLVLSVVEVKVHVVKPFRKLFRLTGLLFPALYLWTSKEVTLAFTTVLLLLFLGLEGLRFRWPAVNETLFRYGSIILRERERTRLTSVTWFLLGALPAVLLFTRQVAVTAWLFFLFGDVAAEQYFVTGRDRVQPSEAKARSSQGEGEGKRSKTRRRQWSPSTAREETEKTA